MTKRWTFLRLVRAAAKLRHDWWVANGQVRCEDGRCPLAVVFGMRLRLPGPDILPVRTRAERLALWRVAYASDSAISPDHQTLRRELGL